MTKKAKHVYGEWRARVMRAEEKIEHLNEKIANLTSQRDITLTQLRTARQTIEKQKEDLADSQAEAVEAVEQAENLEESQ